MKKFKLSEMQPPVLECNIGSDYQNRKVNQYLAGLMAQYDSIVKDIEDKKQEIPSDAKNILIEHFDLCLKVNRNYHNKTVLHPITNKLIENKQYTICQETSEIIEFTDN